MSDGLVSVGLCEGGFEIGGVSVGLAASRSNDVALIPSLEPFRAKTGSSDIRVNVERVPRLALTRGRQLFDTGRTWRLHEEGSEFVFDFQTAALGEQPYKRLLIDSRFRRATLQMNEACFARAGYVASPLEYPLDELLIMHRLTQEKAIELHGCGIVAPGEQSNLFVGHSGAGKSTTTRLWTSSQPGVEVLSDDRIIVRRESTAAEIPRGAVSAPGRHKVLRLRDCSASRASHCAQDDREKRNCSSHGNEEQSGGSAQDGKQPTSDCAQDDRARNGRGPILMYGTPWHGEARYASPASAPLGRIFILEHGRGNVLTRLSRGQAVAELFARSFVPFYRHDYVQSALAFLEEVAEAIPCYRYSFEPNLGAVETILNFHD